VDFILSYETPSAAGLPSHSRFDEARAASPYSGYIVGYETPSAASRHLPQGGEENPINGRVFPPGGEIKRGFPPKRKPPLIFIVTGEPKSLVGYATPAVWLLPKIAHRAIS